MGLVKHVMAREQQMLGKDLRPFQFWEWDKGQLKGKKKKMSNT